MCRHAQDALPLSESPYLMHPIETKNNGLYQSPVVILDFASLYPSLYRAYNLCYTTLLHPDDSSAFPPEQVTVTPTGVVPHFNNTSACVRMAVCRTYFNKGFFASLYDSGSVTVAACANVLRGMRPNKASVCCRCCVCEA